MLVKLIGKRKSKSSKHDSGDAKAAAKGGSASSAGRSAQQSQQSQQPQPQPQQQLSLQLQQQQQQAANGHSYYAETLPSLGEVSSSEKPTLFIKKLRLCCYTFDFTDPSKNLREKEIKQRALIELVDYMGAGAGKLTEAAMEESCKMIAANLFRTLPPPPFHDSALADSYDPEDEETVMDPAWPHLQPVYEFLLRFIMNQEMDAKVAKRYVDHSFVLHLLDLFESEDHREREYLKTILHRIYGKFMVHRPFVRKAINNIFYHFIYETERHNGMSELLEIVGSIIIGFALPLKEEHKLFLVRALIPLHKPKPVAMYHQQLSYCITQFVEKDFKLVDTVVRGLLKYWPLTNSQKEVLFLGELEEVLEAAQSAEFQRCMGPLFRQIAQCICSPHFQSEPFFLWNNDHIVNLIVQNRTAILPLIFKALETNIKNHWNRAVQGLTLNVRKMFLDTDPELFHECQKKYQEEVAKLRAVEEKRERAWKRLESVALSKAPSVAAVSMGLTKA